MNLAMALVKYGKLRIRRTNRPPRSWPEFFHHVKSLGFSTRTIIDVGVFEGTPELYAAFPDAHLLLFEADPDCRVHLERIMEQRNGRYWLAAAGRQQGETDFWIRPSGWSSLLSSGGTPGRAIKVPVVRIDQVITEVTEPAILKIDAEGFELDVLDGSTGLLRHIEMIIMEVRFIKYHEHMSEFAEVVASLNDLGYAVYDILDGIYRPTDHALDFVDLVLVRQDGLLRSKLSRKHYGPQPVNHDASDAPIPVGGLRS
jgi:FkbM family methyltransferase